MFRVGNTHQCELSHTKVWPQSRQCTLHWSYSAVTKTLTKAICSCHPTKNASYVRKYKPCYCQLHHFSHKKMLWCVHSWLFLFQEHKVYYMKSYKDSARLHFAINHQKIKPRTSSRELLCIFFQSLSHPFATHNLLHAFQIQSEI